MKKATATAPTLAEKQSRGRKYIDEIRRKRRKANQCVFCGSALPDPRERKKMKLEQKIASLREQIRQLSVPEAPKLVAARADEEDVPLAVQARKRH